VASWLLHLAPDQADWVLVSTGQEHCVFVLGQDTLHLSQCLSPSAVKLGTGELNFGG